MFWYAICQEVTNWSSSVWGWKGGICKALYSSDLTSEMSLSRQKRSENAV